jgi:hypothetical protein
MMYRLNSPLFCAAATAVVISIFIFGRLHQAGYDFSSFVTAGDVYCNPAQVPPGLKVLPNSAGFDGQFYYRLALNPFTSKATDYGITIDDPALRHQRVLYPLLTWILSGGNARAVPVVMILLNLLGLITLAWIGGHYAVTLKQHALWGMFVPLYPGFLLTLSRDLVEILEITLLLSSLLLLRRARPLAATLLLSLAVLTKETSLLVALAALGVYLFRRWKTKDLGGLKWYYFTVPCAIFAVLQVVLFRNWGTFPIHASNESNLGIPLVGVAGFALNTLRTLQRPAIIELVFLIIFSLGVLYHLRSSFTSPLEKLAPIAFAALAVSLGRVVWTEDWTFLRAVSQFCVLGTIVLMGARSRSRVFAFAASGVCWLYLFIRLMRHYS